ncbi:MAG: dCTP deaminase [Synechococcales cyanobacterium RU_4_20]|nr:dCTP deaminase [Synechococcales cyanobacterium RU_4_20]
MIKSDRWIKEMAAQGMITPFEDKLVRRTDAGLAVISYGLSSYGYDIRLSPADFRIFRHVPGTVIDPKRFNPHNLEPAELHQDELGPFFILPGHSYGLGVALEKLAVPDNATVLCIGKSTYARAGIIANLTPAEAGWRGHLTLEFSNSSPADARIYAGEGCVQLLFFEGVPCEVSYETRKGKYQDQEEQVTIARV